MSKSVLTIDLSEVQYDEVHILNWGGRSLTRVRMDGSDDLLEACEEALGLLGYSAHRKDVADLCRRMAMAIYKAKGEMDKWEKLKANNS